MNSTLLDIDEVAPLSLKDEACIREIKAVLGKYDSLSRFGLTLLHQHFDVADDEMLVEECDAENRRLTIMPQKLSALAGIPTVSTNWRLDTGAVMAKCIQVRPKDRDFPGKHTGKRQHLR